MSKIVAVIVTFNRLEQLKITVAATLKEAVDTCLVVNNASTDGTSQWLNSIDDKRLAIIHSERNVGGAGGFEMGFKAAIEQHEADWLVCYDDDAYPQAGVIAKFKDKLNQYSKNTGAVAAAVYSRAGGIVEMNRPGLKPFSSLAQTFKTITKGRMGFHIADESYRDQPRQIYNASFVGFFVKNEAIKRIGYPRPELFIYGDDVLYSMDLVDSGFNVLFDPQLEFVHDCKTIDKIDVTYKPLWKAYYTHRNSMEIYRRESGVLFPLILISKVILWTTKARFYKQKSLYLKLLYHSISDGLKGDYSRTHEQIVREFS